MRSLVVAVLLAALALGLPGCGEDAPPPSRKIALPTETPAATGALLPKGLGLLPEDVEPLYNEAAARLGSTALTPPAEISERDWGTLVKLKFSPTVSLMATAHGGAVDGILLTFAGGGEAEAARFILCSVTLLEAVLPGLTEEERDSVLSQIGFFDASAQEGSVVFRGIKVGHSKAGGAVTFSLSAS